MRDFNMIPQVEINNDKFEILKINNLSVCDIPDYDLDDPKELNKYLDTIKNTVRNSFEYQEYTKFLREGISMNKCSFYQNVNNIDTFKIKIHIHHEPFTLPNIISIVFNKRCACRESLDVNMVAKETMYLHYLLLVGLVPLSETVHELVHNNFLYIPMDKVLGAVNKFVELYKPYIDCDLLDMLSRNNEFTKEYNSVKNKNIDVLNKHYIYLDPSGAYSLPELQTVVNSMNSRIKELENNDELVTAIKHINSNS